MAVSAQPIAIVLKSLGPFFIYIIFRRTSLTFHSFLTLLLIVYIINFFTSVYQYFYMDSMKLINNVGNIYWESQESGSILYKRVVGLLGNANALGAYTLISIIVLKPYFSDKPIRRFFLYLSAFLLIFIFAKSRNSMAIFLVLIFLEIYKNHKYLSLFYLGLLTVFVTFVFSNVDLDLIDAVLRISSFESGNDTLSVRGVINLESFEIWRNELFIFGGGFYSESYYLQKYNASSLFTESLYLKVLIELGLLGFVVFFSFILYLKEKCVRKDLISRFNLLMFVFFTVGFFETVFNIQQLYFFLFIIFGYYSNYRYTL